MKNIERIKFIIALVLISSSTISALLLFYSVSNDNRLGIFSSKFSPVFETGIYQPTIIYLGVIALSGTILLTFSKKK